MKKLHVMLGFSLLVTTVLSQTPVPSMVEKDTQKVAELLKTLQLYSFNTSEPRSVGLYQIDSLLQGNYDTETGLFSEVNYKTIFNYTDRGFPEEAYFYYWNGNSFQVYTRYHFSFCTDGKIEAFLWQYMDSATSDWTDYAQNLFTYNTRGQLEAAVCYVANYDKVLIPVSRVLYGYNEAGLLSSQLDQVHVADKWLNEYELTYLYNEQDYVASVSYWVYVGEEQPIELSRIKYQYNIRHQLIAQLKLSANFSNGQLSLEERDTFIYDEKDRLIEEIHDRFPVEDGWQLSTKTVYAYGKYNIPFFLQNFFKGTQGDWSNSSQSEIEINQNYDITAIKIYIFNRQDSSFLPKVWYDFSRDEKIRLKNLNFGSIIWLDSWVFSNLSFHGSEHGTFAIQTHGVYSWDTETENWQSADGEGRFRFYYSSGTTTSSSEPEMAPRFLAYPNPTDRLLSVETERSETPFNLYLYNLLGQRVFRKNISGNEQVVLPDLPEGTYVLQLIKGNEILGSKRVIIKH